MLARGDVDEAKEWAKIKERPKSASVQHKVPVVTVEVLQGTARDCNSRKTGNGANGQSVAQNSNVCNGVKISMCIITGITASRCQSCPQI